MRSTPLAALAIAALSFATAASGREAGADSEPTAPAAALAPEAAAPTAPVAVPEGDAKDKTAQPDEQAIRAMVRREAEGVGLPPEIAEAVTEVESGYNQRAVGGVGEIGLMQVLPSTARMLGFSEPLPKLFDPETNIKYGVRYLGEAWKMTGEDICGTVMKYRAGHGETRFSHRSVAYCVRVRAILAARGYKVTGTVPVATFGAPAGVLGPAGSGLRRFANGRVRMRFNWSTVDSRRRALDKAGAVNLRIAD
ncbi:lytic transglycosylase domain-containing protein [Hansschlegelia zhihuaiae]|uniref:Lytic transglycosylase domain-containing protein n=1 Tax=Hansschlegelia zhihuaiae TaxID=405005 RepID=A0A4Q0MPV2_9HYPH|nr:transglycosylase SLT domain-containing protein [Hansschlegelia zhihuaiae]RXF75653.1 lytic transglycosylase domain-containing protein [Hansschlegelia zhihuaiae]